MNVRCSDFGSCWLDYTITKTANLCTFLLTIICKGSLQGMDIARISQGWVTPLIVLLCIESALGKKIFFFFQQIYDNTLLRFIDLVIVAVNVEINFFQHHHSSSNLVSLLKYLRSRALRPPRILSLLPGCVHFGKERMWYRSVTVNSKSFVGKVFLQIK